jgi:DNA-binding NarL/FixJ family response regulator
MEVVGAASGGSVAVELAVSTRPDVVLMDLSMPDLDGVAATRAIRDLVPRARVVVLTSFSDPPRILSALDAGATGYLMKDSEPDELYRAIRAAARGESPLAPKAASVVLSARANHAPRGSALSSRERDVLGLLAQGQPNKVIARTLGIAEKTVKSHVTRILKALDAADRTEAALWAQRHGFV